MSKEPMDWCPKCAAMAPVGIACISHSGLSVDDQLAELERFGNREGIDALVGVLSAMKAATGDGQEAS